MSSPLPSENAGSFTEARTHPFVFVESCTSWPFVYGRIALFYVLVTVKTMGPARADTRSSFIWNSSLHDLFIIFPGWGLGPEAGSSGRMEKKDFE